MDPERIAAPDVRTKVMKDSALLDCAYDDDKFKKYHLTGAISLNEFRSKTNDMEKINSLT